MWQLQEEGVMGWVGGWGALHPVTHNLTHVCPPREGLHVSSAANQETDVRRVERRVVFPCCFYCDAVHPPPKKIKIKINKSFWWVTNTCKIESLLLATVLPLLFCVPCSSLSSPLNPSASCRSVRLPVSVPIRFHLIHVTSINTQSSPDKSRPLSPPLCLSRVAVHHSLLPNEPSLLSLLTYKRSSTRRYPASPSVKSPPPARLDSFPFLVLFPAHSCWCPLHPWRWRCLNYSFG